MRKIEDLLFVDQFVREIEIREEPLRARLYRIDIHMIRQRKLLRIISSREDNATPDELGVTLFRVAVLKAEVECHCAKLELDRIQREMQCTDAKIEHHVRTLYHHK